MTSKHFVRAVAIADMTKFPNFMNAADPQDPKSVPTPDQTPQLTFLINAYNGLFYKAIADAYPINTPGQIKNLYGAQRRAALREKSVSFEDLRRQIGGIDPRALFALTDGTKDGPRASSAVYSYFNLSGELNRAAQDYVNDLSKVKEPVRLQNMVEVTPWIASVDEFFAPRGGRSKLEWHQKSSDQLSPRARATSAILRRAIIRSSSVSATLRSTKP